MNITYFLFFICIVVCTLIITYWAAKKSNTTSQFYTAAGSLTGTQNGLAIAGDYISAASFLGIIGAIALYGYDGFLYSIGFLVSYLIVLLLVSEPVHHLGKFSLGDVICARFANRRMRIMMAVSSFIISILYLIPQLVAAGLLIRLLLDINYTASVLVIGSLMTIYVAFGGMLATSWVQIIKTIVLLGGTFLLSLIVFSRVQWNIPDLIHKVKEGSIWKEQYFLTGHLFDSPIELISLSLALILGTAGLPHILIRLYTVRNTVEVRRSILTATWIIGGFYLMTLIIGFGAVAFIGYEQLYKVDSTGNLAAPLLAQELGGDFLLAFISAIAFTTIVAVVAGLVISATTAFSHDIYHHIIKKGKSTEKEQLQAAQWTAVGIGIIAVLFALGLENVNVTFLVSLTFTVAASSNFPVLFFTLYWKRFNETGAMVGMICGLFTSLLLLLLGPHVMDPDTGWIKMKAFHGLYNPGILAIPIGFLSAMIGTHFAKPQPSQVFYQFYQRAHTGMDMGRDEK